MSEALPRNATGRKRLCRRPCAIISLVAAVLLLCSSATTAQPSGPSTGIRGPIQGRPAPSRPAAVEAPGVSELLRGGPDAWTSPEGLGSTLKVMLLLTVLSLAPAVLLMTTSFVRIVIVLGLLRQALGTQQLPPNQVITSMSLFLTLLIMTPVWKESYEQGIQPYNEGRIGLAEAWDAGIRPIRRFMTMQIDRTGNSDDIWLFLEYMPDRPTPQQYDDVPLQALLPAFMLSELKTAFLIGFQIYLPFVILDMVISSVMISMGMLMLPPVLISLPFKLLMFVLADGWHLVIGMLMESFQPFT
ncbi:MAG: flagellar type III secretion system pore protein FliP [Pirellulales bacterium]